MSLVAGVDEAGRGPLAGPVVAAAVILDSRRLPAGLTDSKKLSAARRESLAHEIRNTALAWSLGRAEVNEIDTLNILHASMLAMRRALDGLQPAPAAVWVDGNRCPGWRITARAIVGGDRLEACISAASIVAKVARDSEMLSLAVRYPGYGFEQHKGYPTAAHIDALQRLGPSEIHRQSFAPVRKAMQGGENVTAP